MAYDEALAARVRRSLVGHPGVSERRMFGGLAFLVHGHMCCGVAGDRLMVRVGPEAYDAALAEPHASEMDFTGRPLRGMVYVAPAGVARDEDLERWTRRGLSFTQALPPK